MTECEHEWYNLPYDYTADVYLTACAKCGISELTYIRYPDKPDSIPDYSQPPTTNFFVDHVRSPSFLGGALAALKFLGDDETLTHDQLIERGRQLTHECRYYLNRLKNQ